MSPLPTLAALGGSAAGRLVVLEPLSLAHGDGLRAAARDGDLFGWMFGDLAQDGEFDAWLESSLADAGAGSAVPFTILAASDGRVLGTTRYLELRLEHRRVEIGWTWLARSAWSTGANVETKLLLLERAFAAGCRRVEFKTHAANQRSRGALTALGAEFEGVLRRHMVLPDGTPRDSAYFSVIDEEWPALRDALGERLAGLGVR